MNRNGFTLVEMLIALTIFGMLGAASLALLTVSVRTQETSDRLLDQVGDLRRTAALLTADLALAAPRLYRDEEGRQVQAFAGGAGDRPGLLALVRRGWDRGEGSQPRRVAWRLREGRLERLSFDRIDGRSDALVVPLLHHVSEARLRYRDRDGEWRDRWDPTDPTRLPVAVELVLRREREGLIRQLFLVGDPT